MDDAVGGRVKCRPDVVFFSVRAGARVRAFAACGARTSPLRASSCSRSVIGLDLAEEAGAVCELADAEDFGQRLAEIAKVRRVPRSTPARNLQSCDQQRHIFAGVVVLGVVGSLHDRAVTISRSPPRNIAAATPAARRTLEVAA